jgi:hypothetical protein
MIFQKKHALSFLVSAALFIFLFSRVNFQQVFSIIGSANLLLFLATVCLTVISLSIKSFRWGLFLAVYKKKIKMLDVFSSFLASVFVANATPARLGEATRSYFLKRRYKTSFFSMLPAILVERLLDLIVLIVYSLLFLSLFSSMVSTILKIVMLFTAFIVMLMIIVFFNKRVSNSMMNLFFRAFSFIKQISKMKPRVKKFMGKFYEGTAALKKAKFLTIIIITALVWFIESLTLFIVTSSLNITMPLLYCIGFTSLAILGGTLSSLPGGLGSTELILFSFFVLLGYSEPISLSITLLHRFCTFGIGIFITAIFFVREVKN